MERRHWIVPETELVIMRYKARNAGLEGVAWYCERCRQQLFRHVFDTASTYPQQGYLDGCHAFNNDPARRRCTSCDAEHPPVDLTPFRWQELADKLQS